MILLKVTNLQASYGAIKALRGLSFQMDEGQVITLIGANGAGKSTILNTLSGLQKAKMGQVIFNGRDITNLAPNRIVADGLIQVPEGRQVIANMSVYENLTIGANVRGEKQIKSLLDDIFGRFPRLAERRGQKAGLLSGGEQQMLAVGRALMMRPRLLMLDEPSMGLAPLLVNQIFDIIKEIKTQGIPILLVEQNARKALEIADYAYVLERGSITREGAAHELSQDEQVISAYLG